jgi:ATP-dependent DNA helicase RecQ
MVDIGQLARECLEVDELRPGLEEAARLAIEGHDLLAVMPTGYGKSAIYLLAGLASGRTTVVVSPLLALQDDQARHIGEERLGVTVELNSTLTLHERRAALGRVAAGEVRFLFCAPEQFEHDDLFEALAATPVAHFVVDEAHTISSWGHDFRPDYLRLGEVIDRLGHPPVAALTATAAPPVRVEILDRLHLRSPRVLVRGFDRPNLRLEAETFVEASDKDNAVLARAVTLSAGGRSGLVYVGTRRRAEELAAALDRGPIRAAAYHAGLSQGHRQDVYQRFLTGTVRVVVATTAFGMGIDKPDVRFVLHADIAESLDAYYQEIGRAGRDGRPGDTVLFYRHEDLALPRFFGGGGLKAGEIHRVVEWLAAKEGAATTVKALRSDLDLSEHQATTVLDALEEANGLTVGSDGSVQVLREALASAGERAAAGQDVRHAIVRSRIEMMRAYAETDDCRGRFLLNYFGERHEQLCGHCDNCESGTASRHGSVADARFHQGALVRHNQWGDGQVVHTDGDTVIVLFDELGYKTISLRLATGHILVPRENPPPQP